MSYCTVSTLKPMTSCIISSTFHWDPIVFYNLFVLNKKVIFRSQPSWMWDNREFLQKEIKI